MKAPNILLVDDEERNLQLLEALCENLGYGTLMARNGREAIEQVSPHMPDVVPPPCTISGRSGFPIPSS